MRCTLCISMYIWSFFFTHPLACHHISSVTKFCWLWSSMGLSHTVLLCHFIAITSLLKLLVQVDLNPWLLTGTVLGFEPYGSLQWLEELMTISLLSHHLLAWWPVACYNKSKSQTKSWHTEILISQQKQTSDHLVCMLSKVPALHPFTRNRCHKKQAARFS